MTKILIKRSSKDVLIPKYETPGSSGMDVSAYIEKNVEIQPGEKALISTGLSVSIPEGYEIQIRPRSGLAAKKVSVCLIHLVQLTLTTGEKSKLFW